MMIILVSSILFGFYLKTATKTLNFSETKINETRFMTRALPRVQIISAQIRTQLLNCLTNNNSIRSEPLLSCAQISLNPEAQNLNERVSLNCIGEYQADGSFQSECTRDIERLPKKFHMTYSNIEEGQINTLRVNLSLHQPELRNFSLLYTGIEIENLNWSEGENGLVGLFWSPQFLNEIAQDENRSSAKVNFLGNTSLEGLITNLSASDPRDPETCQTNPNQQECRPSVNANTGTHVDLQNGILYNSSSPDIGNLSASFNYERDNASVQVGDVNDSETLIGFSQENGCEIKFKARAEDEWQTRVLRPGDRIGVRAPKATLIGEPEEASLSLCSDVGIVAETIDLRVSISDRYSGRNRISLFGKQIQIPETAKELKPMGYQNPRTFDQIINSNSWISSYLDGFDTSAAYLIAVDNFEISPRISQDRHGVKLGNWKTGPILAPQPPQIGTTVNGSASGFIGRESIGNSAFLSSAVPFLDQVIEVNSNGLQLSFEGLHFDHSTNKILANAQYEVPLN